MIQEPKTNTNLVKWCQFWLTQKTIYMLGGFGRILSDIIRLHFHSVDARIKNGCAHTIANEARIRQGIGLRCFDCVGLIKGFLWWDYAKNRPEYKTINGVRVESSEGNVGTFWNQAVEKGTFDSMPDIPGIICLLYSNGKWRHAGVYIGTVDGKKQYIESTPAFGIWGVGKTDETKRKWSHWCKHPLITYLKPVEVTKLRFKKGDKVIFNGYLYANSTMGGQGKMLKDYMGTIAMTASPNSPAPYHLNSVGWVREQDLKLYVEPRYNVGDKVRIRPSATQYSTGKNIPSWVKMLTYTVKQVGTKNHPTGILLGLINSWVDKRDIYKV